MNAFLRFSHHLKSPNRAKRKSNTSINGAKHKSDASIPALPTERRAFDGIVFTV